MSPGHHADEPEKYRANEVCDAGQFEAERLKLGGGFMLWWISCPAWGAPGGLLSRVLTLFNEIR